MRTVQWVQEVQPLILEAVNDANRSAHINVVDGDDTVYRAIDLMREANHMAIALLNEL